MTAARVSGMTQAMRGRDRDPSRRAGAGCGRAASEALDGGLVSKKNEKCFCETCSGHASVCEGANNASDALVAAE